MLAQLRHRKRVPMLMVQVVVLTLALGLRSQEVLKMVIVLIRVVSVLILNAAPRAPQLPLPPIPMLWLARAQVTRKWQVLVPLIFGRIVQALQINVRFILFAVSKLIQSQIVLLPHLERAPLTLSVQFVLVVHTVITLVTVQLAVALPMLLLLPVPQDLTLLQLRVIAEVSLMKKYARYAQMAHFKRYHMQILVARIVKKARNLSIPNQRVRRVLMAHFRSKTMHLALRASSAIKEVHLRPKHLLAVHAVKVNFRSKTMHLALRASFVTRQESLWIPWLKSVKTASLEDTKTKQEFPSR
jgi:hypothetical protein